MRKAGNIVDATYTTLVLVRRSLRKNIVRERKNIVTVGHKT
jgi:hypothetical protein